MKKIILTIIVTLGCLFGYLMIFVGLSNQDIVNFSTPETLSDEIHYNKAKYGADNFAEDYGYSYIKDLYTLDISKYKQDDSKPTIYLFLMNWCSSCVGAVDFMGKIANEYGQYFNVKIYNVEDSDNNGLLLGKVRKEFNTKSEDMPVLVIGDHYYDSLMDSDTQEKIKQDIVDYSNNENRYDIMQHLPFLFYIN